MAWASVVVVLLVGVYSVGVTPRHPPVGGLRAALHSLHATPHTCTPDATQSIASFDIARLLEGITIDYGYPDYCTNALHSTYCRLFLEFRCVRGDGATESLRRDVFSCLNANTPDGGLCVTANRTRCPLSSLKDMLVELSVIPSSTSIILQSVYGYGGACVTHKDVPAYCTNLSYTVLTPVCNLDGGVEVFDDRGASVTLFTGAAIVALALACTAVRAASDMYGAWYGPESEVESLLPTSTLLQAMEQRRGIKSLLHPRVASFLSVLDLRTHLATLFDARERRTLPDDPHTGFFDGVRVIALSFVVYGHTLFFPYTTIGPENVFRLHNYITSYASIGVYPAVLAVDVFFFLSGFLAMNAFVRLKGFRPLRDVPLAYVNRYLRLTPNVAAALLYTVFVIPHAVGGVLRSATTRSAIIASCRGYWWPVLTYVANLHKPWSSCLGWFWYLDCDMQLFLVVPWIALLYRHFKIAALSFLAASIVAGGGLAYQYQPFSIGDHYIKAYFRYPPYMWGLLCAGIVRLSWVRRLVADPRRRVVLHIVATGLLVTCINIIWKLNVDTTLTFEVKGVCNAVVVLTWGLALTLISVCWCWHPDGLVSSFLRHPFFVVLSRLTYSMYVIHPLLILTISADAYHVPSFTPVDFYRNFGGNWVFTAVLAVGLFIFVEQPSAVVVKAALSLLRGGGGGAS